MPRPILTIDDDRLQYKLRELRRRGQDMRPVFAAIGEDLVSSIQQSFETGGRYSTPGDPVGGSKPWKRLSTATEERRQSRGHWPGKILMESGRLASSIDRQTVGNDYVVVGTNLEYAAIHQYGGRAGRGRKVTIPPRPYLVAQPEDIEDALDLVRDHLRRGMDR